MAQIYKINPDQPDRCRYVHDSVAMHELRAKFGSKQFTKDVAMTALVNKGINTFTAAALLQRLVKSAHLLMEIRE